MLSSNFSLNFKSPISFERYSISELSYKDHVFTYTESERGGPATPIQTFSSNEEARKFIIDKGHITFQDGRLTGKIIFAVKLRLEDKYNLHTVREYLDSIS